MSILWIALTVAVLALLVMPYWLAPIQLRFHRRMVSRPRLVPFDPSQHELPRTMTEFVERASGSLVPLGFAMVADLWRADFSEMRGVVLTRDAKTGAEVWRADFSAMRVVFMRDAKTGEEATVVAVRGDDGREQTVVEFTITFADGRELNVNNSGLSVFAPVPGKVTERFPAVRDAASLCRISRELIRKRYAGVRVAPPDDGGDPAAYLTAAMHGELANQVATGYYRWDEGGQAFWPTWKGAVLMTWKHLPPFLQIREARMRRRADLLIKELGVT